MPGADDHGAPARRVTADVAESFGDELPGGLTARYATTMDDVRSRGGAARRRGRSPVAGPLLHPRRGRRKPARPKCLPARPWRLRPGASAAPQTASQPTPARPIRQRSAFDDIRAAAPFPSTTAAVYHDLASGVRDDRPGLDSCLRALRKDDVLVVWKLDRLGRNLAHLVNTVQDLAAHGVGLRVLAGQGAQVDTTTAGGRLVFGIFAALAEFERELIRERTVAGLEAARARGRKGGRKFALSKAQVRLAQSAMAHRDTSVSELCRELGIRPVTLYRYRRPAGPVAGAGPQGSRHLSPRG